MPVKVRGLNFLEDKLNAALIPATTKIAHDLEERIIAEMPSRTGRMRESTSVQIINGKLLFRAIVKITAPYARAVWKGLNPDVYSVSPAPGNIDGMFFTIDDWPQYDGRFGNRTAFLFKQTLRKYIPANDFIGRALKNLGFVKRNIIREINTVFRK